MKKKKINNSRTKRAKDVSNNTQRNINTHFSVFIKQYSTLPIIRVIYFLSMLKDHSFSIFWQKSVLKHCCEQGCEETGSLIHTAAGSVNWYNFDEKQSGNVYQDAE